MEVAYAPVLPCLKVPERKPGVWGAFRPPATFKPPQWIKPTGAKKIMGGLVRKKTSIGGFKSPTLLGGQVATGFPTPPLLVPIAEPELEPPAPPPVSVPPPAPAAVDPNIVPLILWAPKEGTGETGSPVSVDPVLCKFLREHQREGVQFMFDCVHGLKGPGINGCILADDMGLGACLAHILLLAERKEERR